MRHGDRLQPSPARFPGRAVLGEEAVSVFLPPGPIIVAEHRADGVHHPLCVAGIKVELAQKVAVIVGDGDRCLDRPRRDSRGLEP